MEISKIVSRGMLPYEVDVIFTGEFYYMRNDFHGLLGIAKRDYSNEGEPTFTVYTRNSRTVGSYLNSSTCARILKRFIVKSENKYVHHDTFHFLEPEPDQDLDLSTKSMRIEIL
jgi:hypothetical protein